MNTKRKYRNANAVIPEYIYEIDVDVVGANGKIKTYRLTPHTSLTVDWKHGKTPGLKKGTYTFLYAENVNGTLIIYTDFNGMRKTIREADIKTVSRRE